MHVILDWLSAHHALLWWVASLSLIVFIGTLVLIPVVIARLPQDYFVRDTLADARRQWRYPLMHAGVMMARNLLGVMFVLMGIAMLVLPGQGLLTMLIGIGLVDFPGKFKLQKRLARQPTVLRSLNWIRHKTGRPALLPPDIVVSSVND